MGKSKNSSDLYFGSRGVPPNPPENPPPGSQSYDSGQSSQPDASFYVSGQARSGEANRNGQPTQDIFQSTLASASKTGGPLQTYDEKFDHNPVTGTCSLSIPIGLPVGTRQNAVQPQLSLSYDSGGGRGPFGLGWNISVGSVSRLGPGGRGTPNYEANGGDTFSIPGADYLVPMPGKAQEVAGYSVKRYNPRIIAGNTQKIECFSSLTDPNDVYWRVIAGNNITQIYGADIGSRITDGEERGGRIYAWLLSKTLDCYGNAVFFTYKKEDTVNVDLSLRGEQHRGPLTNRYLTSIRYGNTTPYGGDSWDPDNAKQWFYEMKFGYGEGQDGKWKCRPDPFSTYQSGFEIRTYRRCEEITIHGPSWMLAEGSDATLRRYSFSYEATTDSGGSLLKDVTCTGYTVGSGDSLTLPPISFEYSQAPAPKSLVMKTTDQGLVDAVDGDTSYSFLDINGEGIPSLMKIDAEGWYRRRNLTVEDDSSDSGYSGGTGPVFGDWELLTPTPPTNSKTASFADVDGDSKVELVDWCEGFYRQNEKDGKFFWEGFQAFDSVLNVDIHADPNYRFVDLTGDGLVDVMLVNGDDHIVWHRSLGPKGHGPAQLVQIPEDGPKVRMLSADVTEGIYLADMSGDGSLDLVRVASDLHVCYWPNLGYGHFGKKITMDNGPGGAGIQPSSFNQKRVFLVDVDGSGTTDLLYLPPGGGVVLFTNRGGTSWADAVHIDCFPEIDADTSVTVADLFGNGTNCLVWSRTNTPKLSYIDLTAGLKPNLLTRYRNGSGGETILEYTSSSRLYNEDRLNGERAWLTTLSHPVHCLTKKTLLETTIKSPPNVTRYRYRHGYFDGVEREFRGFGMVETWDAEQGSVLGTITKTWYHLGTVLNSAKFEKEYSDSTNVLTSLPDAVMNGQLFNIDEAYRALKGSQLHSETFGLDGKLYTVEDHGYTVQLTAPGDEGGLSIFQVNPMESVSSQLPVIDQSEERKDTRTWSLEIDEYGSVRKSATISYGRNAASAEAEQKKTWVIYNDSDFTNAIDTENSFRIPVAYKSASYEIEYPADGKLTREYLVTDGPRKLLRAQQTRYLSDTLSQLEFGKLESFGLVDGIFALAFTKEILTKAYGDEQLSLADAGFVNNIDGDTDHWWTQSVNSMLYDPEDSRDPIQQAKSSFFSTIAVIDAWGNKTLIGYDEYLMYPNLRTDAVGNETKAEFDYFTGKAKHVIDENGNKTIYSFGPLGQSSRVALLAAGDSLDDSTTVTNNPPSAEENIKDWARRFLGKATSAAVADFSSLPHKTYSVQREKFADESSRLQISVSYSDGYGRNLQTRTSASSKQSKWLSTGWQESDNRGLTVKTYEPFFSDKHEFNRGEATSGIYNAAFYDHLSRNIGNIAPNGAWTKSVIGVWKQEAWDQGDNVSKNPEDDPDIGPQMKDVAIDPYSPKQKDLVYANTPAVTLVDSLGRTYKAIADNGTDATTGQKQLIVNKSVLSATGNVLEVIDSKQRSALTNLAHDLLGNVLRSKSIDSGEERAFKDINGAALISWTGRTDIGKITQKYDQLRRPTEELVDGAVMKRFVYGDTGDVPTDEEQLRGRLYIAYDQAGTVKYKYDFRGLALESERKLVKDFTKQADWSNDVQLDDNTWLQASTYDALGRAITKTKEGKYISTFQYDDRGILETVDAGPDSAATVKSMVYNERGQITNMDLGNGCTTKFTYDPKTFELSRKQTLNVKNKNTTIQDLNYEYDALSKLTKVTDKADQDIYFRGSVAKPVSEYTYDAIGRLVQATGRENVSEDEKSKTSNGKSNPQAIVNYTETYTYDTEGNTTLLEHDILDRKTSKWTSVYEYFDGCNRLRSYTGKENGRTEVTYDGPGGAKGLPDKVGKVKTLKWAYDNQLAASSAQDDTAGGQTVWTYYRYDYKGQRVLKASELEAGSGNTKFKATVYLGSSHDCYMKNNKDGWDTALRSLHVNAGFRVATVELGGSISGSLVRYKISDAQDFVNLELGADGNVVYREEHTPYGTLTCGDPEGGGSDQAPKRYRFAHRDRDNETGLYYSLHRYLVPGIGRWLTPDPIGIAGGSLNVYCYVNNDPVNHSDSNGLQPQDTDPTPTPSRKRPHGDARRDQPDEGPTAPKRERDNREDERRLVERWTREFGERMHFLEEAGTTGPYVDAPSVNGNRLMRSALEDSQGRPLWEELHTYGYGQTDNSQIMVVFRAINGVEGAEGFLSHGTDISPDGRPTITGVINGQFGIHAAEDVARQQALPALGRTEGQGTGREFTMLSCMSISSRAAEEFSRVLGDEVRGLTSNVGYMRGNLLGYAIPMLQVGPVHEISRRALLDTIVQPGGMQILTGNGERTVRGMPRMEVDVDPDDPMEGPPQQNTFMLGGRRWDFNYTMDVSADRLAALWK